MRAKLIEASQVYSKDQETIAWFVMQDHKDPRAWCIVERYEQESILSSAKSTTSRTPIGRHSTRMFSRSSTSRWICAASMNSIPPSL
ncbi:hypothetical protein C8R44DRAFT_170816 [Mycena epipterygia]|nr:hypothetical protein C8R44DRAFT_170816 [Mycena epipterygia]